MEKTSCGNFFCLFLKKNFKNPKNGTETEKTICIM